MMRSFLVLVSVAVLSSAACAEQFPTVVQSSVSFEPVQFVGAGDCPGGVCSRVAATIQAVGAAAVDTGRVVRGVWTNPNVTPWYVNAPAVVPSRMAFQPCQPVRNVIRWVLR